jgi:tetratricopeptide (TPR) repeat protein
MVCMMNFSRKVLAATKPMKTQFLVALIAVAGTLMSLCSVAILAQSPSPPLREVNTVKGTVRSSAGGLLVGAIVRLEEKERSNSLETKTRADGSFVFSGVGPGVYTVRAEKAGWREGASNPLVLNAGDKKHVDLVLESLAMDHPGASGASSSSGSAASAMEFDDKPNFTVAGVTDWNNTGMHGSDVNVRTSEALAREMLALKNDGLVVNSAVETKRRAKSLDSGKSQKELLAAREQARKMLANADTADGHRLLGELNERLGDPLEAVREFERAALMDPSDQNYFEWGTELLVHRADGPAVEVFTKGSHAHPDSARMLAGLGAALYAVGNTEEAARRLCEASDLNPADPAPYVFLGKMEKAAPALLPCGEQKQARFVREQPENALANYYYGVTLWKRDRGSKHAAGLQQAETLLEKAVSIDPKLGEAYLQLGILHSERGDFERAIRDYKKAIEMRPQLSEAHYRLGVTYRRTKEESKAEEEFQEYEKMEKAETAEIERQRRELRQFLVILKDQPAASSPR